MFACGFACFVLCVCLVAYVLRRTSGRLVLRVIVCMRLRGWVHVCVVVCVCVMLLHGAFVCVCVCALVCMVVCVDGLVRLCVRVCVGLGGCWCVDLVGIVLAVCVCTLLWLFCCVSVCGCMVVW